MVILRSAAVPDRLGSFGIQCTGILFFPVQFLAGICHTVILVPGSRDPFGNVCCVSGDLGGNDALFYIIHVGESQMLGRSHIAKEGCTVHGCYSSTDGSCDVIITRSNVGYQRTEDIEGSAHTDALLYLHVCGYLIQGHMTGTFHHDLYIMIPGTFGQFSQTDKLLDLTYIRCIGQTARTAGITERDGDIVFLTDVQDLVKMFIEGIFLTGHAHPGEDKASATADNVHFSFVVLDLFTWMCVDFVTLHCGITRKTIEQIKKHKRKMNIVSRGGSLVFAWMSMTGEENPFYEHFDEILDICEEYDVTISLGDACRPGCLADATDVCQIEELVRLGELTKRAWDHNVQVMVEGPGHVPLDQVAANMKVQQSICMGAPFYVLGPLVTDIAPGYDHITAAIGGAVAAMNGAAFLCYVTPAEHLALPNVDDVKQGIIASKIAAHAADIAKGIPGARDQDDRMADARQKLDWEKQYACALDPETAKAIRDSRRPEDDHSDTCSMCGKFCAVRSMNKALAGEYIDIL